MGNSSSLSKKCFMSHSSQDIIFLNDLENQLRSHFDKEGYSFFYTSGAVDSTYIGDKRSDAIRKALQESDIMIAVITDSYLRSIICIQEISVFWYLKKTIIPIVFDKDGKDFLVELMGEDVIYIDLENKEKKSIELNASKMINSMASNGFVVSNQNQAHLLDELIRLFTQGEQGRPQRPYIGSGENYHNIDQYCENYGINLFKNTNLPLDELIRRIKGCDHLYILATTGSNLINALSSEFLPSALAEGMCLTVLLPNRRSSFISDVAEIEAPENYEEHADRFEREFDSVIYNLKNCLKRAAVLNPDNCGEVYLGCSYNLIRQTVILAVQNNKIWGWLSITIPPKRAVDGTPSFEFSASTGTVSVGQLIYDHIISVRDLAIKRNTYYRLSKCPNFHEFFLENKSAEDYWRNLYETAKQNTLFKDGEYDLIEVAAQHPLSKNGTPGREFEKRLDRAVLLYNQLGEEGINAKIYIPGSLHRFKGKTDSLPLSESGKHYLMSKGVPEKDLLAEEENHRYKGEQGVYNTADECYVASQIFLDGDFRRLHCICSANQILRKKLFYIAFGVIPYYYTVSMDYMAHDDIYELFHSVPDIIAFDHTWQGSDSIHGNRTRRERNPKYPE